MVPDVAPVSDDHVLTGLAEEAVRALAHQLAAQARGAPDGEGGTDGIATATGEPAPEALTELDRLRALSYLSRAVERCARDQAAAAAQAGANYPQLGDAWGITRQGARRRWPGLVFTAQPASRPLPSTQHRSTAVNPFSIDRPYSVLLVEDDLADALLVEEALVARGMARTITQVTDGIAALEHLRDPETERPDLIVLDLNMPRMNGRELLAVLKDDPALGPIPVVVLTTSAAPDDIEGAYRQHANAYVAKPVNLDEFITAVQGIDAFFLDTATLPRP
ncbi:response regulator [Streptomyces liangshanensis]|uniref:Response regulator n=1 Tax=Streptomyces liangshanensis TaxID=2717324 RepID=A0A6G9GT30_9ACTN|nr:response regulator [Streptomyces liangshanensis]QIQ01229.1 response regulator [Streptomyces liangshanensis]